MKADLRFMEEYMYDEVDYDNRIDKLENEFKSLLSEGKLDENNINVNLEKIQKLKNQINDMIDELEVEDFLMHGSGFKKKTKKKL